MFCPNCGKQINEGDMFCAYCRTRLNAQPAPQPVQPTFQQNYQPEAPAGKQSSAGVIIAAAAACVVLAASFVLFIKPGYLLEKKDESSQSAADVSENTAESTAPVSAATTAAPETIFPSEAGSPVENEAETLATTTTVETTTAVPKPAEDHSAALAEAAGYSTRERPTPEEFGWCYGQFGYVYLSGLFSNTRLDCLQ